MCVIVIMIRVRPVNSTLDPSLVVVPRRDDPQQSRVGTREETCADTKGTASILDQAPSLARSKREWVPQ